MGHQDKGIFITLKVGLQPLNMLHIQEVGRLVQNEDIRALEQQLGQQYLGTLAAGKGINRLVQANIPQAQSSCHFLNLAVQCVEAMSLQNVLDISHISHHLVNFLRAGLPHLIVGLKHLLLQLVHIVKGGFQHITDAHTSLQHCILIQIAGGNTLGPFHLAFIWCQLSGNNG